MRIAAIVGAVVLVAVVAIAVLLVSNLDSLVADAIESYGSRAAGTAVSVDSVSIDLRAGRGTIRGLTVANPEGFDEPYALRWGEVTVEIDPASLSSSPWVIDEVRIDAPKVTLAVDDRGRVNLRELEKGLKRGKGKASEPESSSAGEAPRLEIRSFDFERGQVEVHAAEAGGRNASAELPPLHLKDLGGASGATPADIGGEVLAAYTRQVLQSVARRELGHQIDEALGDQLGDEASGAAAGLLDRLRGK